MPTGHQLVMGKRVARIRVLTKVLTSVSNLIPCSAIENRRGWEP